MDLRRLSAGDWLAGVGGVALLVSLFVPWYAPDSATGWESLASFDILLALVAAAGVLLPVVTAVQRVPAVPIALAGLVTIVGLLGVVLVLIRILDLPDGAAGREWGLWLALASAAGIVLGGCLAMREERWPADGRDEIKTIPAPQP
jgi:FtsH-binding integral membrane protein